LCDRNRLLVRPGSDEADTSIIEISFRCEEAELAAQVVAAIVSGYESYLHREDTNSSSKKTEMLARLRDEYNRCAKAVRSEYLRLSKASSEILGGDDFRLPLSQTTSEVHQHIVGIQIRKSKHESLIATIQQVLNDEDGDLESLLSMIARVEPSVATMTP